MFDLSVRKTAPELAGLVAAGVVAWRTCPAAKNGEAVANGANITFKDGKRLFVGGSAPEEQPQK